MSSAGPATTGYLYFMIVSLLLGLATGFTLHRSGFCMAGAFRDLFLFRQWFMLRILILAIIASMVLFELARIAGALLYPFPLFGAPSLANIIGGFIFGTGMVLAGGCVVGTLCRMGGGSLLGATAFMGIITGSTLYAEFHPAWQALVRKFPALSGNITLPQAFGISPTLATTMVVVPAAFCIHNWFRNGKMQRFSPADGYIQPWLAAVLLAMIGLLSGILVGMPLGITTAYTKIGAYLETYFCPEHLAGLTYFKAIPLDYHHPLSNNFLSGGPGPRFDAMASIQFPLVAGIAIGSMLSAALVKELRLYVRAPGRQFASALAGGILMGLASRMAPACNIWHFLGGLPILAGQSILFLLGLLPGAWLGSRIMTRIVIKA
jgi:uncharacterized membrane protein YedE/YeeE